MLIPPVLNRNDTIGIVSPSHPVTIGFMPQWEQGIKFIQELGFKVKVAKNALNPSPTPQQKAEDIHQLFEDPIVNAIICA